MLSASFPNKSRADGRPGVVCRYNHDDEFLLGTTRSGTLRLSIDETGLNYDVNVPECRNDVLEMVSRGDVAHSSFAFQVFEEDWGMSDQGYPLRTLISGRLIDVAPVCEPAYPDSTVGLRSLAKHLGVPYEDVAKLSKENELRKFFVRTDRRSLSGAEAQARVRAKAHAPRAVPSTPREVRQRLLEKRYPLGTLGERVTSATPLDPRLARLRALGRAVGRIGHWPGATDSGDLLAAAATVAPPAGGPGPSTVLGPAILGQGVGSIALPAPAPGGAYRALPRRCDPPDVPDAHLRLRRGLAQQPAPAGRRVAQELGYAAFNHRQRDPLARFLSSLVHVDRDQLGGLLHAHLGSMPTPRPGKRADMGDASAPFTTVSHEIGCVALRFNS